MSLLFCGILIAFFRSNFDVWFLLTLYVKMTRQPCVCNLTFPLHIHFIFFSLNYFLNQLVCGDDSRYQFSNVWRSKRNFLKGKDCMDRQLLIFWNVKIWTCVQKNITNYLFTQKDDYLNFSKLGIEPLLISVHF